MIQKRGHAEDEDDDRASSTKRSRASISPAPLSSGEVKGKSGLRPSSEGGDHSKRNESDNDHDEEEDDDYTSSSGSSSSSSDEDEDEVDEGDDVEEENNTHTQSSLSKTETITYIPGRPKPQISLPPNSSDLLSRISSFLPQLQAANADIEQRLAKGESLEDLILDDVKDAETEDGEEGKEYIEMNLGLGVLKEKKRKRQPGDISLGDESSSDSDNDEENDEVSLKESTEEDGEGQVLNELMGLKSRSGQKPRTKPGIQEVDEG
ncbi:hypothetical protein DPV78_003908 [Talaromyces pinophilus]|nr:hypothetical protein DPV78_003908 [Talaromyces pinophilus]PCG88572.1 Hypothetical protein PENO1_109460 [Penicillium occitanis (nom. inval.)]PCG95211.1 hypothetical protein PENOC_078960 [Penicillium occitanis (nom. inval.)]